MPWLLLARKLLTISCLHRHLSRLVEMTQNAANRGNLGQVAALKEG
jgi:hypothetical protein